jgi:hypothetical protein
VVYPTEPEPNVADSREDRRKEVAEPSRAGAVSLRRARAPGSRVGPSRSVDDDDAGKWAVARPHTAPDECFGDDGSGSRQGDRAGADCRRASLKAELMPVGPLGRRNRMRASGAGRSRASPRQMVGPPGVPGVANRQPVCSVSAPRCGGIFIPVRRRLRPRLKLGLGRRWLSRTPCCP